MKRSINERWGLLMKEGFVKEGGGVSKGGGSLAKEGGSLVKERFINEEGGC